MVKFWPSSNKKKRQRGAQATSGRVGFAVTGGGAKGGFQDSEGLSRAGDVVAPLRKQAGHGRNELQGQYSSSKLLWPLAALMEDPTWLSWSKTGPQLVIGTARGNLIIYNKRTRDSGSLVDRTSSEMSARGP